MAERRMFAKSIIDSDVFLDMPLSTQALYFHLSMRADDEGFISNPKKIMRMINATQNELDILLAKRYLLAFESGIVVIKHWRIHNLIRKDRAKETLYTEERGSLTQKKCGAYTEVNKSLPDIDIEDRQPNDNQMTTNCPPSIGKDSIVENSINNINVQFEQDFDLFWEAYNKKEGKKKAMAAYISLAKKKSLPDIEIHINIIKKWHATKKWQDGFQPHATTWLNGERWNDQITSSSKIKYPEGERNFTVESREWRGNE